MGIKGHTNKIKYRREMSEAKERKGTKEWEQIGEEVREEIRGRKKQKRAYHSPFKDRSYDIYHIISSCEYLPSLLLPLFFLFLSLFFIVYHFSSFSFSQVTSHFMPLLLRYFEVSDQRS